MKPNYCNSHETTKGCASGEEHMTSSHGNAPLPGFSVGQIQIYEDFVRLLAQLGEAEMLKVLQSALHDAQDTALLADYFGADESS